MSDRKVGFEVVPVMFTGIPPPPLLPRPAIWVRPETAPPLRLATILKSRALLGLMVPAPVTVPRAGITRLILSRRVPSGVYRTSGLRFWIFVSLLLPVACLPVRAEIAE